ncbi:MAG: hypothetical protein IJD48_03755, partial [Clostridia bacterium]|nr:hypothetical protein [Clostridia bacterium]
NKKNKKNLYPLFNYFINHYTFNHLTNGMFVKNLQKSIVIFYLIKLTLFKFYLKDKQFFNRNFLTFTSSFSRAIEHTQSIEVIEENMAEIFSEYN